MGSMSLDWPIKCTQYVPFKNVCHSLILQRTCTTFHKIPKNPVILHKCNFFSAVATVLKTLKHNYVFLCVFTCLYKCEVWDWISALSKKV